MVDIEISQKAQDELRDLPSDIQSRIREKFIDEVAANPDRHLTTLSGREEFRVRIGDYRAIVDWDKAQDVIRILKIGHRRNIYR